MSPDMAFGRHIRATYSAGAKTGWSHKTDWLPQLPPWTRHALSRLLHRMLRIKTLLGVGQLSFAGILPNVLRGRYPLQAIDMDRDHTPEVVRRAVHELSTNQITIEFLRFISDRQTTHLVALDIGCGFGVATMPALETGANVIALDLYQSHLDAVREQAVQNGIADRLKTVQGRFPTGLQFEDLTAIHSSQVLHFITGNEIEEGARRTHAWLKSGGKVFIQVGTIYAGHIKQLVPQFEAKSLRGTRWPGEVENARDFVIQESRDATPQFMNYLSGPPLVEAFESAGFHTEKSWYYTRTGLGPPFVNDGREHFGYVGVKTL